MNSKQIQDSVSNLFSNHDHQFRNKYIFGHDWESDYFSVTKSGYLYEVEIKISKSDFIADFSKFKHKLFENRNESEVIKEAKFKKRGSRMIRKSPEKNLNPQNTRMPNKFFFACPEGLIKIEDIPEYAGLIYIDEFSAKVIKNAPLIHKRKENIKELLFSKYQWGYVNTKNDLEVLEKKHNSVCNKFDTMCRGLEKKFKLPEGSVTSMNALNNLLKNID